MNSHVKISVVIPCYNVEKYVRECLDSVLNQSLKDIQIICVNDGSTDGTPAILEEYAHKHPEIEVVHKPNGGLSSARNAGLAHAQGEYVHFLDSDDYLQEDALAQLYENASTNQLDMLFFDGETFFEDEAQREQFSAYATLYTSQTVIREVLSGPGMYMALIRGKSFRVSACMYITRLDFIRERGLSFFEGIYYEDNLFTTAAILQAGRVGQLAKPFYKRRMHDDSIVTSRKNYRHVRSYMICIFETISFLERNHYGREIIECTQQRIKSLYQNAKKAYDELLPEEKSQVATDYADSAWINLFLNSGSGENQTESLLRTLAREQWSRAPYDPEQPYITVVSPVCADETKLREEIDGLLAQSLQNFEVWFVTVSQDDSAVSIIEAYAAKDARIKLHRKENSCPGAACNTGLELAKGEYVIFLDANNRFDPDLLALTYSQAKSSDAEIVMFDAALLQMPQKAVTAPRWLQQTSRLPQNAFSGEEAKNLILSGQIPWTRLYRRSFIKENGIRFQELSSTNDLHFAMVALAAAKRIVALPVRLLYHHTGENVNLLSVTDDSPLDAFEACLETKRQLQARGLDPAFAAPLAAKSAEVMADALSALGTQEGRKTLYQRLHDGGLKELGVGLLTGKNAQPSCSQAAIDLCAFIQERPFEQYEKQRAKLTPQKTSSSAAVNVESVETLRAEINALRNSWAYRLGSRITYLPHRLKSLLKR